MHTSAMCICICICIRSLGQKESRLHIDGVALNDNEIDTLYYYLRN